MIFDRLRSALASYDLAADRSRRANLYALRQQHTLSPDAPSLRERIWAASREQEDADAALAELVAAVRDVCAAAGPTLPQDAPACVRCGAPFAPEGSCSRRSEGCQGGRGEVQNAPTAADPALARLSRRDLQGIRWDAAHETSVPHAVVSLAAPMAALDARATADLAAFLLGALPPQEARRVALSALGLVAPRELDGEAMAGPGDVSDELALAAAEEGARARAGLGHWTDDACLQGPPARVATEARSCIGRPYVDPRWDDVVRAFVAGARWRAGR